jgi:hypothetical protein
VSIHPKPFLHNPYVCRHDCSLILLSLGSIGLAIFSFVVFGTFPGWHREKDSRTGDDVDLKPYPNELKALCCVASTLLGAFFTLLSALWQHTASATTATILRASAVSVVKANVGSAGVALAWFVVVVWISVFLASLVIHLELLLLNRLTDDE